jgi:hypothetical protein
MMAGKPRRGLAGLLMIGLAFAAPLVAGPFDHHHSALTGILARHVQDTGVDYAALQAHPQELKHYLEQLAAVDRSTFEAWTVPQQIAFLTNAYNAFTLQLIVDHYPLGSIKDIGSFFRGPWDRPVVRLFGRAISLNTLEHRVLRVDYAEPRLHFALVCAAKGCPPLRPEAYTGGRLDEQLDEQARRFLGQPEKNRVDAAARIVHLSPIFKWYGEDFEQASGSVLAALQPYWPELTDAGSAVGGYRIRYTDYDWSLNDRNGS